MNVVGPRSGDSLKNFGLRSVEPLLGISYRLEAAAAAVAWSFVGNNFEQDCSLRINLTKLRVLFYHSEKGQSEGTLGGPRFR